ncbi:MAG: hypothetical protein HY293_01280 [Planctomycetes bacterium]|nr:hypothetical protein [Planctomycetota bacterium]
MRNSFALILVFSLGVGLAGCTPQQVPLKVAEVEGKHLSFLRDGVTTREEVLLRFGDPTGEYESGRILTFRIEANEKGVIPVRRELDRNFGGVTQWSIANLSVVTVFDETNILRRHSLIAVRP